MRGGVYNFSLKKISRNFTPKTATNGEFTRVLPCCGAALRVALPPLRLAPIPLVEGSPSWLQQYWGHLCIMQLSLHVAQNEVSHRCLLCNNLQNGVITPCQGSAKVTESPRGCCSDIITHRGNNRRCINFLAEICRKFLQAEKGRYKNRAQPQGALKGSNTRGQTPICGFLRAPAKISGFLQNSAFPKCFVFKEKARLCRTQQKSAKICVWARFVPLGLSR